MWPPPVIINVDGAIRGRNQLNIPTELTGASEHQPRSQQEAARRGVEIVAISNCGRRVCIADLIQPWSPPSCMSRCYDTPVADAGGH